MKNSNGTAGLVAIALAVAGLVAVVATDQVLRHRPEPVRTSAPAPVREAPSEAATAPADSLQLTPSDAALPPPGETLTI